MTVKAVTNAVARSARSGTESGFVVWLDAWKTDGAPGEGGPGVEGEGAGESDMGGPDPKGGK